MSSENDTPLFAALLQQIDLVALTLDAAGAITAVNGAAERAFDRPAARLVGQPFSAAVDRFSRDKAALMLERTRREGGVTGWELDHARPAGPPVLVGYTTTLLRDAAGSVLGFGAIGRDLTGKLEITAQLAQTNQQLEGALLQLEKAHAELQATQMQLVQSEKMRALGQMVAGVAHEINNPIAFVANNLAHLGRIAPGLQALVAAYAPLKPAAGSPQGAAIDAAEAAVQIAYVWQDLADLVSESQEGVERVRNIVLSLRNFARLDEAETNLADLNDGLRSTVKLVHPLCGDRIAIAADYGPLPLIQCRPGELNQVFLNLLANAVQAIAAGGTISIASRLAANAVVITVGDTGAGMDAATLARLGEPFFTTKPVGAGTGLGLAVSLGIVARHHGTLRFTSQPGQGTTVVLSIPLPA